MPLIKFKYNFFLVLLGIFVCSLFLSNDNILFAQSKNKIDSLKNLLNTSNDSLKVELLNELRFESIKGDPANALKYAKEAYSLAKKIKFKEGEARSLDGIGTVYEYFGDYTKGFQYHLSALEINEEMNNKKGTSRSLNSIGVLFFRQRKFTLALDYYKQALKIAEEINDKEFTSIYLLNIGEAYLEKGDVKKALEYENKALKLSTALKLVDNIAFCNGIIGSAYGKMGDWNKAALYHQTALNTFKSLHDRFATIEYTINLGKSKLKLNDPKSAKLLADTALKNSIEIQSLLWKRESYQLLAEISAYNQDFKTAYSHSKTVSVLKDSVLNEHNDKKLSLIELRFKAEKAETEIRVLSQEKAIQENESKQQSIIINFLVILVTLIIIVIIIMYINNLQKNKINKVLLEQKQEIEKSNKEITDSINYAQKIQSAMLPDENYIRKYLPESFVFFKPKSIVSGDFYWFYQHENLSIFIAADCTGHGVPGAFMSMIGNDLLDKIIIESRIFQTDLILKHLHIGIKKALRQEKTDNSDGMDIAICIWDNESKKLQFSGAMNPLYLISNYQMTIYKGDKHSIGGNRKQDNLEFTTHEIYITNPTTVYLSSDGFQDQFGGKDNKKYMVKRFRQFLWEISEQDMDTQKDLLDQELAHWMQGSNSQTDDIIVLAFKIS